MRMYSHKTVSFNNFKEKRNSKYVIFDLDIHLQKSLNAIKVEVDKVV